MISVSPTPENPLKNSMCSLPAIRPPVSLLFLAACTPAPPAEVPAIDELGWMASLRAERPDVFRSDCWNAATLKPEHRAAFLSGTETYAELLARSYNEADRAADRAWMARQQAAIVAFCEAHPGSGGCGSVCNSPCEACPDEKLYGGTHVRPVRPAGYGLCGAVGYVVGEGPGGQRYDPLGTVDSWKVFFTFDPAQTETITPELYHDYFVKLEAAGYRGDAKMVTTTAEPQRLRFQYNNVIVHAWSPADGLIAERVGLEHFAGTLTAHGRGLDVMGRDWHTFLCQDQLGVLSEEALAYVGFGTAPAVPNPATPLAAYGEEDLGVRVSWHPALAPELRAQVAAALRTDLAAIRTRAPGVDLTEVRIAVSAGEKRGMGFHRSAAWLTTHGYDADREGVIELFDARDYLDARVGRPMVLVPSLTWALDPGGDGTAAEAWFAASGGCDTAPGVWRKGCDD